MVLLTGAGVIVAIISIIVANQARSEVADYTTNNGDTMIVENYYADSDGAPGEADPEAGQSCGATDSAVAGGWGPDRPTFLLNYPPSYATLNSIRDNPNIGDERGLMRVRDLAIEGTTYAYQIAVEPGHTYRVSIYVENSTTDDVLELAARDTMLKVNLPTCTGERIAANAFISSPSAFPREIWGGITFTSESSFDLRYVDGSARLESNAHPGPEGLALDADALFSNPGVALGYEDMDGVVIPGYQYAMYISFDVTPQFASN